MRTVLLLLLLLSFCSIHESDHFGTELENGNDCQNSRNVIIKQYMVLKEVRTNMGTFLSLLCKQTR